MIGAGAGLGKGGAGLRPGQLGPNMETSNKLTNIKKSETRDKRDKMAMMVKMLLMAAGVLLVIASKWAGTKFGWPVAAALVIAAMAMAAAVIALGMKMKGQE